MRRLRLQRRRGDSLQDRLSCAWRSAIGALLAGALGAASAQGLVHAPADPELVRSGETLYLSNCAACHQANGQGMGRIFPPVAGAAVLDDLPRLIEIVLFGVPRTAMAGRCDLHAKELAALLTYLRNAWGRQDEPVTAGEVLEVVKANASKPCRTAELSRAPLAQTVFDFGADFLQQRVLVALVQQQQNQALTRASGRIVRDAGGTLYALTLHPLLREASASAPLPAPLGGLASCAFSSYAARLGAKGWRLSRTSAQPDARFPYAYEFATLDESETLAAKAASGPQQVAFFTDEWYASCSRVLEARHVWAAPWPVRNALGPGAYKIQGCDKLTAMQDGVEIAAINGELRLARKPFSLRYRGNEAEPSLHVARYPELSQTLGQLGRDNVVASTASRIALAPRDLPVRSDFQLGLAPDAPGVIPRAAGGFELEPGQAGWIYPVDTIAQVPVERSVARDLHLTYFGVTEPTDPRAGVAKMTWGACRLVLD